MSTAEGSRGGYDETRIAGQEDAFVSAEGKEKMGVFLLPGESVFAAVAARGSTASHPAPQDHVGGKHAVPVMEPGISAVLFGSVADGL